MAEILEPGGYFLAVIPDKNFTFDSFRPLTTLTGTPATPPQTTHRLRTAMSSRVNTHNNAGRQWLCRHGQSKLATTYRTPFLRNTFMAFSKKQNAYLPQGKRMSHTL